METIKSYLETMFANMPNTPEVIRAKTELLGMMEDKYNELIQEGKSENEAVGTVISEFGNLDELADTLGINSQPHEAADNRRILSLDEVKSCILKTQLSCCTRRYVMYIFTCIPNNRRFV